MNLQRLKILRHGKGIYAVDDRTEQSYPVVNPGLVPDGMEEGIFSIDDENKTASFESRKAEPSYQWGTRRKPATPPPTRVSSLPDGTKVFHLLGGEVLVTVKGEECYVDAPLLPPGAAQLVLAQALEGMNLATPEYAKALLYILKG
jgi:hypothetical protein